MTHHGVLGAGRAATGRWCAGSMGIARRGPPRGSSTYAIGTPG